MGEGVIFRPFQVADIIIRARLGFHPFALQLIVLAILLVGMIPQVKMRADQLGMPSRGFRVFQRIGIFVQPVGIDQARRVLVGMRGNGFQ